MGSASVSVPRSTVSCPSASSSARIVSRSRTPRWSNATATLIAFVTLPLMEGPALWRELGQQLRVDSIRCAAAGKSAHPTSGMSAADLMAFLLAKYYRYDFDDPKSRPNHRLVFTQCHASTLLY